MQGSANLAGHPGILWIRLVASPSRQSDVVVASNAGQLIAATPAGDIVWDKTFNGAALGGAAVGANGTIYVRANGVFASGGSTPVACAPVLSPPDDDMGGGGSADGSAGDDAGNTGCGSSSGTPLGPLGVSVILLLVGRLRKRTAC